MVRYLLDPFNACLTSISRGFQWVHGTKVFVEAFLHLPTSINISDLIQLLLYPYFVTVGDNGACVSCMPRSADSTGSEGLSGTSHSE